MGTNEYGTIYADSGDGQVHKNQHNFALYFTMNDVFFGTGWCVAI